MNILSSTMVILLVILIIKCITIKDIESRSYVVKIIVITDQFKIITGNYNKQHKQ